MTDEKYDVIIIGGGPSGLYSSFCCGVRQLRVKVIEARATLGGRIPLYQEQLIWDLAGSQGKLGSDIANNLIQGAKHFESDISLNQKVTKISKQGSDFVVTTQDDVTYHAKTVILASALGIMQPRTLKIAKDHDYKNLHYPEVEVIDFKAYADKTVLVYGNPDSISEYAIILQKIAKQVILVTKKTAVPDATSFSDNVIIHTNTDLASLDATDAIISSVQLASGEKIDVTEVLVHLGTKREANPITFENFDLAMIDQHGHAFVENNSDTTTNVAGLFVVGDLGGYEGKNYLLSASLSEATQAATQVALYLDETAEEKLIVSTHNDIFKAKNAGLKLQYFN